MSEENRKKTLCLGVDDEKTVEYKLRHVPHVEVLSALLVVLVGEQYLPQYHAVHQQFPANVFRYLVQVVVLWSVLLLLQPVRVLRKVGEVLL